MAEARVQELPALRSTSLRALLEEIDIESGWATGYALIPCPRGSDARGVELTFETGMIV